MLYSDIVEKVNAILREEFEIERELTPDLLLRDDLGIDSLDFVDVAVFVHENFGFKLAQKDLKELKTVQDLYDCIKVGSINSPIIQKMQQ